MLRFLVILTIASVAGLQGWMILFNNFAVEVAGLEGHHVGIIQSVREIPGFLALLAIFVMLFIREHRLSALSIVFLGVGTALAGFFPSYGGLLATTLLMSFGFHYFETTNQSLTLQYFSISQAPLIFGRLRSLSAAASIGVAILIFLLGSIFSYREIFLVIGTMVALVGFWGLFQNPVRQDLVPQYTRMVFRRKYSLFYTLTFLAGARRQIFMAFSVFLMVKVFNFSIKEVTFLFIITNILTYLLSPLIGKAIVHFGERQVLSIEYFGLIFIFLAYALTGSKLVVAGMYVLDHILFNFSIAIRTYFQKIGDPQDIAPSMAVGFTINHIAAVIIPALGGVLWMVDYRIPFFIGAILSFLSLLAAQKIVIAGKEAVSYKL
jgi:predicted MFS family arabinose efflux permease